MALALKNTNIFPLPGNPHMLHLATITSGLHEYIVMLCTKGEHRGKWYIEEVVLTSVDWQKDVFALCKFIDEDDLARELTAFADQHNLRDIKVIVETVLGMGHPEWILP